MVKIEFTTIEDLVTFIHVIRNEELDANKIRSLTAELNKATKPLVEAENNQPKGE